MKLKIYSRLSLTAEDVRGILPKAVTAPPIKRGDIGADLRAGWQVIAIVDGEFNQSLAVTPTEVLDALRCGVKVYGSSSMGALRAAELEPFGMIGHGKVFETLRGSAYFRDDHLGQIYFQEHQASLPMIDLVFGLERLLETGRTDGRTANKIEKAYLKMHYAERSLEGLRALFTTDSRALAAIGALARPTMSTKRADGLGLLRLIKRDLAEIRRTNRMWTLARFGRPKGGRA
jgi:TfuA protein